MIVADASWIIALRDPANAHHSSAVHIVQATTDEEVLLHPVTLAECLVGPAKQGQLEEQAAALRAAFQVVGVESDDPARWARIRVDHGLRLPDAIVLDTAIHHRGRALATFDHQLAHAARGCGIEVLG